MFPRSPIHRLLLGVLAILLTFAFAIEDTSAFGRKRLFNRRTPACRVPVYSVPVCPIVYPCPCPCPDGPDVPCVLRVRQNIKDLSEHQLESLKRGIEAMKALPPSDPRSWRFQANIHGTFDPPTSPLWNQCEHGSLQFLTWHRAYLYYFERILRDLSGDPGLTLPYWDWTENPVLPEPFRNPADASNPLFDSTRFINDGSALPAFVVVNDLNDALQQIPFPPAGFVGFSPSLEGSPHGAVHVLTGGNMSSVPTAANDPIFWLHHCNIDRIWERWLNQGGGRMNPSEAAYLDQTYSFVDEHANTVTVKVRDIISSAKLCYRYDDTPPPQATLARATYMPPAEPKMIRVASSPKGKEPAREAKPLGLEPVSETLSIVEEHRGVLKAAATPKAPGAGKILLQIQGLSAEQVPEYVYAVYLNLPEDVTPEQAKSYYVGSVNFFGKVHDEKRPHRRADRDISTETFDVTQVVVNLREAGAWKEDELTVTLRPLTPMAPKGNEAQLRQRIEASAKKAKPSYKSVGLIVVR